MQKRYLGNGKTNQESATYTKISKFEERMKMKIYSKNKIFKVKFLLISALFAGLLITPVFGVSVCESRFAGGADPTGLNDSTAAVQAAIDFLNSTPTNPPGFDTFGKGVVFFPKGKYKIDIDDSYGNAINLTNGKALGISFEGEGPLSTTIIRTKSTGVLFNIETYKNLSFSNMSIIYAGTTPMNNTCFKINSNAGGSFLVMDKLHTVGFNRVMDVVGNLNGDNTTAKDCNFRNFNTFCYGANSQAVVNRFYSCNFGGRDNSGKVFNIAGFGHISFRDCDIITNDTFLYLRNDTSQYGMTSVYELENCKFEWTSNKTVPKIVDVTGENVSCEIHLNNSGICAGGPGVWGRFAGDQRVFVRGGGYEGKIEVVGCTTSTGAKRPFIQFEGAKITSPDTWSFPAKPSGYGYPNLIFKNCPGITDITIAQDNSYILQPHIVAVIAKQDQSAIRLSYFEGTSYAVPFYGQKCIIINIKARVTSRYGASVKTVQVYKDAAQTQLISTLNIPGGYFEGDEFYDLSLAPNTLSTEGIFITVSNPDINTIKGQFIIEYLCIGG